MKFGARFRAGPAALALALLVAPPASATSTSPATSSKRNSYAMNWNLVTEKDPQSQLAQLRVVIRTGSLADPARLAGLTHFTGRALLRGTRTRPYKDLTDAIERIGATLSVSVDPTQTTFSGMVIAKNFDSFLDILRDLLSQPAFEPLEMATLQAILQGERRTMLQDTQVLAGRALLRKSYLGTPIENSSIGTVENIGRIRPQDAAQLYARSYVQENMLIAIASPWDRDDVVARITDKLGDLPHGALDGRRLPRTTLRGRHAVIVERGGMSTVPLYIGVPGVADNDDDLLALETGNFVFGEDFTSRLVQVLRTENGWTYGAYSSFEQLISPKSEASLFSLYTYPSLEYAHLAIPKALQLLEEYVKNGVSEEELEISREALVNRFPFELDTAEKRLERRMREILTGRPCLSHAEYRARIDAVDLTDLNAVVRRRTPVNDLVVAVVGDAATLRPILTSLPFIETVEVMDVQP